MEVIYSEWVPAVEIRIALAILILVLVTSLFLTKVGSKPQARGFVLFLLVLSGLALWNFWGKEHAGVEFDCNRVLEYHLGER